MNGHARFVAVVAVVVVVVVVVVVIVPTDIISPIHAKGEILALALGLSMLSVLSVPQCLFASVLSMPQWSRCFWCAFLGASDSEVLSGECAKSHRHRERERERDQFRWFGQRKAGWLARGQVRLFTGPHFRYATSQQWTDRPRVCVTLKLFMSHWSDC